MKLVFLKSCAAFLLPALLTMPVSVTASDEKKDEAEVKWSYSGDNGPSHWGDTAPENLTCKEGKNQSPVNINRSFDARLPSIKFDYTMLIGENIVNTGHSIQVNVRNGGLIKLDGEDFELKQFHFHSPSEHMIDGNSFPLEAHFVHANEAGELAVVALLYKPGPPDAALDVLLKNLPMNAGESKRLGAKDIVLFERNKKVNDYFRYNGSLTTPPCTEGVRWIVVKASPTITLQQLQHLQKALKRPNNRPVQPRNARTLLR